MATNRLSSPLCASVDGVLQMERELNQRFFERREVIRMMVFALITGQHFLQLSRTGQAKSMIVEAILGVLEPLGQPIYRAKMTVEDRPSKHLGPLDPQAYLQERRMARNTEGGLLEAYFAYLDELFDSSDDVLRDIMLVLSREFREDGGGLIYKPRLRTCFAASNYMRANEATEAVLDRFMFKVVISAALKTQSHMLIDLAHASGQFSRSLSPFVSSLEELDSLIALTGGAEVDGTKIEIPTHIIIKKGIILARFIEKMHHVNKGGYYLSPRHRAELLKLLRAVALLNQRAWVAENDLYEIRWGLGVVNGEGDEQTHFEEATRSTLNMFSSSKELSAQLGLVSYAHDFLSGKCQQERRDLRDIVKQVGIKSYRSRDHRELILHALRNLKSGEKVIKDFATELLELYGEG